MRLPGALCLAAALSHAPIAAAGASAIFDLWLDEQGAAAIEISRCGDELCATIVWLREPLDDHGEPELDDANPDPTLRSRPVLGLRLLWGFPAVPAKPNEWKGGHIYDPANGKTYKSRLKLRGDTLEVRGFVGIPLLGRTTRWSRLPEDHPAAASPRGVPIAHHGDAAVTRSRRLPIGLLTTSLERHDEAGTRARFGAVTVDVREQDIESQTEQEAPVQQHVDHSSALQREAVSRLVESASRFFGP